MIVSSPDNPPAQNDRRLLISASSVRSTVIGSIVLISTMGFASGVFLISGVYNLAIGNWGYAIQIALVPLFILVIVLHAKRIVAQTGPSSSREYER